MPYGRVGPGVVTEPVPEPEDPAGRVAGDLDVVELPALVAGADEVLEAVLGPLDGAAEPHRRVRDQDLLRVEEHDLRAEAAPGVRGDDLDLELRQPEDPRQTVLDGERRLRRAPHPELAGPRVVLRHDAARLDRAAAAPLDVEPLPQDVGRPRERRVWVPHPLGEARRAVPGHVRVDERAAGRRGRLEVGHRRQGLVRRRRSGRRRPPPRSGPRPPRTRRARPRSGPRRPRAAAGSADGSGPDGGSGAATAG